MATTLWFARHGEVDPAYIGSFVGSSDVDLSLVGRHQAAAIDVFLRETGIDAIITSPMQRARQTGAPLAKALGLEPIVRQDLREMDFGAWEGMHWDAIAARDPAFAEAWQADPTNIPCPGGDAAGPFAARVQAEVTRILEEFQGHNIALFAHAGVNRAIMAQILGIPYMQSFALSQDYGCVNAAGWQGDLAQIAMVNFVPGPRSADQGDGERVDSP